MIGRFAEVTGLPVVVRPDGKVVLTTKFIEGMSHYAKHWRGPVSAVMHPVEQVTDNLDNVAVKPADLPFSVEPIAFDSPALRAYVTGCRLVHWGPHHLTHDLGAVMAKAGVPNVYVTEYSLATRLQIIDAEVKNPLLKWRRILWEWQQEKQVKHSIARSSGFEANGTPTFEAYRALNRNHLLYFDTRMSKDLFITPAKLSARLERLRRAERPLELVFSGRLTPMKGALDLIDVAAALRRRGIDFHLSICGDGSLVPSMRARIEQLDLSKHVTMRGVLPFAEALAPMVQDEADLFLCCHRQGDPSCTYLETMACGVPIVGYLNEAFQGLLTRVDAGWGVPLGDADRMAEVVGRLAFARGEIADKAERALDFAKEHTFERTFARRVGFFQRTAEEHRPLRKSA